MSYPYPWFRLYVADWTMGTVSMTASAEGLFVRLLCHSWREGPLPEDTEAIRRIARMDPAEFLHAWQQIRPKWEPQPGLGWTNRRLEEERSRSINRSASAREAVAAREARRQASGDTSNDDRTMDRSSNETRSSQSQSQKQKQSQKQSQSQNPEKRPSRRPSASSSSVDQAVSILGEDFRAIWQDWERHRREIRKPLTPTSIRQQLGELSKMGAMRARAALEHTIARGWQGIREPEKTTGRGAVDWESL